MPSKFKISLWFLWLRNFNKTFFDKTEILLTSMKLDDVRLVVRWRNRLSLMSCSPIEIIEKNCLHNHLKRWNQVKLRNFAGGKLKCLWFNLNFAFNYRSIVFFSNRKLESKQLINHSGFSVENLFRCIFFPKHSIWFESVSICVANCRIKKSMKWKAEHNSVWLRWMKPKINYCAGEAHT